MKKHIITALLALAGAVSCTGFLTENPKTFLSPDNYFKSQEQMQAAVNGLYTFVDDIFDGDVEVGTHRFIFLEYMTGYGRRPRVATSIYLTQANLLTVTEENWNLEGLWQSWYAAIENCNYTIAGIEAATVSVPELQKNLFLGEAYSLRAYYYFNLVRLWESVPLKTSPTTDLSSVEIPLSTAGQVYAQIEADLVKADELMKDASWARADGHIGKGAVKALMSKVYLTMAGYPLCLGKDYYEKAYDAAHDVYASGAFRLFDSYSGLRDETNENSGEILWSIQREPDRAGSPVHNDMLPYPAQTELSANAAYGGALAPTVEFLNSYAEGDMRLDSGGYYYSEHPSLDGSKTLELGDTYIYKWWDANAASTGKSGLDYPLIRYADVLLAMAEAKACADGGATSDKDAVEAYSLVRKRAMPAEMKPSAVTFDMVYKERLWELCFETQTWFDMLRTRKALDVQTGNVVDLIGYRTPGHEAVFAEKDLVFPYPLRESRLNPNLKR
ncbi:MAG: RagB/SusD family nutrient uptake outer membrane protein [Bacteroidales bacterium]|nr:RagB/SusD family nutrient uptake outer membrane protein [Bacteroidales bacterium]